MEQRKYRKLVSRVQIGSSGFFNRVKITRIDDVDKTNSIKKNAKTIKNRKLEEKESVIKPVYSVHIGSSGFFNRVKITRVENADEINLINENAQTITTKKIKEKESLLRPISKKANLSRKKGLFNKLHTILKNKSK